MDSHCSEEAAEVLSLTSTLITKVKSTLKDLYHNPYPHVPNPPTCKRRASVALIIRIRPAFPYQAFYDTNKCGVIAGSFEERLVNFFAQDWVKQGDPEILFIKRAARQGDRWTSHVAFPGGKRESDDLDDHTTSVRETKEETGLDLDVGHFLMVGNLAERVVTTSWGKVPLMVLCPFVYLAMRYDLPPLTLQPSEVGSAHWVSIRAFLSPALRTYERCDVADRRTQPGHQISRAVLRAMLGKMLFGAVELIPSESIYCSTIPSFLLDDQTPEIKTTTIHTRLKSWWLEADSRTNAIRQPLLLWGLTLGITADLVGVVSPKGAQGLWAWPTLSPWDMRSVIWIMTYNFRKRACPESSSPSVDAMSDNDNPRTTELGGLDVETFTTSIKRSSHALRLVSGEVSLDGYFDLVRKAIIATLSARLAVSALIVGLLVRRYRRRSS